MRILIGHNHYQNRGGEDAVVEAESSLLKEKGEDVFLYERSNKEVNEQNIFQNASHFRRLDWSQTAYDEMKGAIKKFQPDIAHFHNTFFMMTPSVYYACKEAGVPVIQSLHNFRLLCSNGLFYRGNNVCEDCLEKSAWEGIKHRCYRNSFLLTTLVARMIEKHWSQGTWTSMVDTFITATDFTKQKFVKAGIPEEKIRIKPNFVYPDPGVKHNEGEYVLYVGRMSREKGVDTLIEGWKNVRDIPLKIIGDGDLREELGEQAKDISNIEFLGFVSPEEYDRYMRNAKLLVVPSACYENFPRIVAEGYAYGLAIVSSRLGSLAELIREGETGVMFEPGHAADLAAKIQDLWQDSDLIKRMGQKARNDYEEKFAGHRNYELLINIYEEAVKSKDYQCVV